MAEYAGRGDARRTLDLLWGRATPSGRGPRPGLTVDGIVRSAIAMADAEGLAAVSMRRIAERLGRSAMSLYSYVPGKAELLDLMLDRVLEDQPRDHDLSAGWRPALEAAARDAWAFYLRHPWVLQVGGGRVSLGPNEFDQYEANLRLLGRTGLPPIEMARAWAAIDSFVRGAARAVADARAAERETGISDDDWWTARAPQLTELLEAAGERYPTLTLMSAEQAFDQPDRDPDDTTPYLEREALDAFEFGLRLVLDGIEVAVARHARARPST